MPLKPTIKPGTMRIEISIDEEEVFGELISEVDLQDHLNDIVSHVGVSDMIKAVVSHYGQNLVMEELAEQGISTNTPLTIKSCTDYLFANMENITDRELLSVFAMAKAATARLEIYRP